MQKEKFRLLDAVCAQDADVVDEAERIVVVRSKPDEVDDVWNDVRRSGHNMSSLFEQGFPQQSRKLWVSGDGVNGRCLRCGLPGRQMETPDMIAG